MDEVVQEVEKVKREWYETYSKTQEHIKAIGEYGKSGRSEEKISLPRLNGIAQYGLALLSSLQFRLDLLAPQFPTDEEVESASTVLESWKTQSQSLRLSLKNANLQAKENMRKAAQEERELLLGGGGESAVRRRILQTKAGMTPAAKSIAKSLRRTRQSLVQEVERSTGTLVTVGEFSTNCVECFLFGKTVNIQRNQRGELKKAKSEYKGQRFLLMRTRNLLSTTQRQDVMDRIILEVGFFLFYLAVLYVVSKRIGLLKCRERLLKL